MTKELEPLKECPLCNGNVSVSLNGDDESHWFTVTRGHGDDACHCRLFLESEPFVEGDGKRELDALIELWNTRYKRTCHIVIKPTDSDYRDGWRYLCSECGFPIEVGEAEVFADGSTPIVISHAAFCWHCGAEVVDE